MNNCLFNHYEQINKIGQIYDKFFVDFPKVEWKINYSIYFNGNNNNFELKKHFQLIGFDNNNVYIIYVKPALDNLNNNHILINSIYDTFLLNNIKQKPFNREDKENICEKYKNFGNKQIKTIIFALNANNYILIDWIKNNVNLIIENTNLLKNHVKKSITEKYILDCKNVFCFYKYWCYKLNTIENYEDLISEILIIIRDDDINNLIPTFIIDFFNSLKYEQREQYENKEYFFNKLNMCITRTIERFF